MSNNAVLDNILTRRSCRAYTDRPVSKEDLDTIFKGGNLRTERHEPTVMAVYGNP